MDWGVIWDILGMVCFLPVLGVVYCYRFVGDKLVRNVRGTYRDKVQMRRPVTPTGKDLTTSTAPEVTEGAWSFPWSSTRQPVNRPVLDQLQSPIFRLPVELRLKIWEELLCGRSIHYTGVTSRKVRPWKWVPMVESSQKAQESAEIRRKVLKGAERLPGKMKSPLSVALIRTCRKVYLETIELLYSNRFELLGHPYDLICSRRIDRLSRLNLLIPADRERDRIEDFSEAVFYERPQLARSFDRLRAVPQVDLLLEAVTRRSWFAENLGPYSWLANKEGRLLEMVDKAWTGATGHMTVTVRWKLSPENRERAWSFDLVERPLSVESYERWIGSL